MATFMTRGVALGSASCRGLHTGNHSQTANVAQSMACRCHAVSGPSTSGRSPAGADMAGRKHYSSKYDRIVAFVDAHATPVVPAPLDSSSSFSSMQVEELEQQARWHHSYDEEAEEGELFDEPHLLAFTPAAADMTASTAAPTAAAMSATVLVHSWSYGDVVNPKPWCYSWDEEAEGSFELSECSRLTPQQAREQRRAAMHEARHAARAARRTRRSQLHAQLGDLEHMQAWVGEEAKQQKQRSAPSMQYQQLLAMVSGDAATRQYRKPKAWHLTFDEECHGDAPETVLGSC